MDFPLLLVGCWSRRPSRRTPRAPPCDRAFVYFFCIVIFLNAAANTSSASRLIISARALQIQLGPFFHFVTSAQQLKSFLGGCGNLLHNINIFCREPSRLRLSDKLTEAIDNSFDSKLQLSVWLRALLAGVCCDKHPRCSSPGRDFCRPR